MSIDLRVRYDEGLRRQVIKLFEDGNGYRIVARLLALPVDTMREWWFKYQRSGPEGVLTIGGKQNHYSFETKVAAARAVVNEGVAKTEVMRIYGIASLALLKNWCRLYREGGEQALAPKPKGRPKGTVAKNQPKTYEQQLEERIRKLEAENAYLKKSIALKAEMGLLTARKPR